MEHEYIIINKTAIQKRIEELKKKKLLSNEVKELKEILSQSTPLIPEIESAYYNGGNMREKEEFDFYISNLKLDI